MDQFALNLIMIIGFVLGSGLIILEAFMPGFGVAGVGGLLLEFAAIYCCWQLFGIGTALLAFAAVAVLIGIALFISYRSALNGRLSKSPLVLKETETPAGNTRPDHWIGMEGVAVTSLRPAGQIEIDGARLNAATDGTFIERGTPVLVTGMEGDHYVIRKKD